MQLEKYRHFTAEDFVLDPQFKEYVLRSPGEDNLFCRALLERFPNKREEIVEARKVVSRLEDYYHRQLPAAEEKAAIYDNIMRRHRERGMDTGSGGFPRSGRWLAAAASFLLLISVAWWLLRQDTPVEQVYATSFAETADYQLPDGSDVFLNANSELQLIGDWSEGSPREVVLRGEAYFKVSKSISEAAKFVVHTDGPDIEVLGTRFNVNTRPGRTVVMLEEGRVELVSEGTSEPSRQLAPGQLADYNGDRLAVISDVDPEKYRSWLKGYFLVDELSLEEVLTQIEYIYGVEIEITEQAQPMEGLVRGALPISDLEELILTFEPLYQVKITQENGKLYVR